MLLLDSACRRAISFGQELHAFLLVLLEHRSWWIEKLILVQTFIIILSFVDIDIVVDFSSPLAACRGIVVSVKVIVMGSAHI